MSNREESTHENEESDTGPQYVAMTAPYTAGPGRVFTARRVAVVATLTELQDGRLTLTLSLSGIPGVPITGSINPDDPTSVQAVILRLRRRYREHGRVAVAEAIQHYRTGVADPSPRSPALPPSAPPGPAAPLRIMRPPGRPPLPTGPTGFPGTWDDATAPEVIKELNRDFAVVVEGGRAMIWRPTAVNDRLLYERLGERDFRLLYANRFVDSETPTGKPTRVDVGKYWLQHTARRQYERVVFDPRPDHAAPAGTLNLWRGLAVCPAPGDWSRLNAHLRDVVCSGDIGHYRYLLHWLARTLQRPDLRGEVAVVLRGPKGAGKGVLGNTLVRVFGQHGLHVSDSRHLTGHFNAHLRDCAFLFADEAFWAGDKAGESVLKSLITEPQIMVEAKYANAVSIENRLSILMASNADWVVPASRDERRYFVLDVAEHRVGDRAYFRALHEELDCGGLAAFVRHLLAVDLHVFDHRDVPNTGALEQQVVQTMDPLDQWWYERLTEGELLGPDALAGGVTGDWERGEVTVVKQAFHDDFLRFCERHRYPTRGRGHATKVMLGVRLRKWLGRGWPRDEWTSGSRSEARYGLPSVFDCRRAFEREHRGLFATDDERPPF